MYLTEPYRVLLLPVAVVLICLISPPGQAEENSEVKLGRKGHEELLKTIHFYRDEALNAYVNEVGQKLAANSDWPEIDYHFFIIDSPDINAFALPGGYIYINRGLLSYLTSEAQLAGVLAHEIAHVTRHHAMRRRNRQNLGDAAAIVATIATLNRNVGKAIRLENAALVSGYGREMELEADQYGASYLYRTGYDPEAMITVLAALKNHQRFSVLKVREAGKEPSTYHGVFSSHPKNDQRLKEVISQAGKLPPGEDFRGRDIYRQMLDNMVFGDNDTTLAAPGYERYATRSLGVTFAYPAGWHRSTENQIIVLTSDDGIRLEISVARPTDKKANAEELLKARHRVEKLKKARQVYKGKGRKDEATYALIKTEQGSKRVAAIKSGAYEYYFDIITPVPLDAKQDKEVIAIIKSFRRAESYDFPPNTIYRVYYHRLEAGETFADLAADKAVGRYTEEQLRLINGYYPSGEPEPGTWIKMAR